MKKKILTTTAIAIALFGLNLKANAQQSASVTVNVVLADVIGVTAAQTETTKKVNFSFKTMDDYTKEQTVGSEGVLSILSTKPYDIKVKGDGDFSRNVGTDKLDLGILQVQLKGNTGVNNGVYGEYYTLTSSDQVVVANAVATAKTTYDAQYKIDPTTISLVQKAKGTYTANLTYTLSQK